MRPEIILGPPGTGKTTALLDILDRELERGVAPEAIGFVSFTRKAAEEAVSRAAERFGFPRSRFPWFRTLHSLAFRQLGLRRDDVLEGPRLQEFGAYAGVRITGRWSEDGTLTGFEPGDRVIHMANLARARCHELRREYDADDDRLPWREVERVARALTAFKAERGLMDYADMLEEFVAGGQRPALEVLLIDEAQDLSRLQWRVVEKLAAGCRRVVVGADDDQAIFEWSGADVGYLVDLDGDVRVLEQSYRVPAAVQGAADGIIGPVKRRRAKAWRPRGEAGTIARLGRFDQTDLGDADGGAADPPILVLARNSYLMREQVEPELRRRGIYYERAGHPSVPRTTLDAIMAWEHLRQGKQITPSEAREAYKLMTSGRGVARGHKELPGFDERSPILIGDLKSRGGLLVDSIWHEALDRLPRADVGYIVRMRQNGEMLSKRPRVRLSTIHAAKGGEADHVVLLREMARRTYREMDENPDAERRVFYVAVTRARSKLTVVDSQTPQECPWI